jgi:hypothetical protein
MSKAERYNVIALFDNERRAQEAVKRLDQAGVENVRLLHPSGKGDGDRVAEMRAEMQDEVVEGVAGPGVGFLTEDQAKGAAWGVVGGTLIGVLVGGVIGLVWALVAESTFTALTRVLLVAGIFGVGGAIAGAVTGGSLKPRTEAAKHHPLALDDKKLEAEADTLVAVHVTDLGVARRAKRLLKDAGAERVDTVNADGRPLPPQSEHPRPADPPNRWWKKGARG